MTTATQTAAALSADELRSSYVETLVRALGVGLDKTTPGHLLGTASVILDAVGHPDVASGTVAQIVRGLAAWDRPETSGGALAIATLADDADLRRWARRDLAVRGFTVPRWLTGLHLATPDARAVELEGPFRDLDDVIIGVTTPSGHALTAAVRLDNELAPRAVDSALFERPVEEVLSHLSAAQDPDVRIRDVDPADARARLDAALAEVRLDAVLPADSTWPAHRRIVRWMLSRFPSGGDARAPGRPDDVDIEEVAAHFLASPWGRPWTRPSLRALVCEVLESGLGNGLGDPLLWAPHHVRRLLDPGLGGVDLESWDIDRMPELLRDLIRYGHGERALRPGLTDASLRAVDRWAPAFLTAVREWGDEVSA
ncbi:hypothetical protein GCU67_00705 [Modestobacter muralis]|uniref:Uncharacterized protein n=1 Tax=Modestobacter muralis TaxID=1608614 RepID=A0A6P0H301_9ACTN|nr:hypothetical protein [Modestobacter muralis]NEK92696.1 hypothetical protein [Modestobacter muralis]NEN49463.1 hypothetical protein [Modestobacter muralis]